MTTIRLHLPGDPTDRSYDIVCGNGLLTGVGDRLRQSGARRAFVVADAAVAGTHAARVADSLTRAEIDHTVFPVACGEASKSLAMLGRLWDEMAHLALDRKTHVVAGGLWPVGRLVGLCRHWSDSLQRAGR